MESNSDFTPRGGGKTITPVKRRSTRIASLGNSLEKDEGNKNDGEITTPTPQQKKRPTIILRTTPSKDSLISQGEDTNINVGQSSNKPPRKKKKGKRKSSSSVAGPVLEREDPSAAGGSSAAAGSSSNQQSTAMDIDEPQQGGVPAPTKGHRVPGLPAVQPRSDTPSHVFDKDNPYSVFSENPAARLPQSSPTPSASSSATPGSSNRASALQSLPSDQVLRNAINGSIQKKITKAKSKTDHSDPSWRHPWGIPVDPVPQSYVPQQYNQPADQGAPMAFVGNALMLLQDQALGLSEQGADEDDVRRSAAAASILGSLMAENAKVGNDKGKGKAPANSQAEQSYQSRIKFQKTALSKIKQANYSAFGSEPPISESSKGKEKEAETGVVHHCTFCKYPCDWGVSDERILLPEETSTGTCQECDVANSSFFAEWTTIMDTRTDQDSKNYLEKDRRETAKKAEKAAPQNKKVYSSIDGADITKFMGPMFCKSCPWRQIDITQVKICDIHRKEKFAIIKHHRHQEFRQIAHAMPGDLFSADQIRGMNMNTAEYAVRGDIARHDKLNANFKENRRCMMCTGLATDVCVGCPLRLCSTCSVLLKNICKGYLDNLFYHYERHHLRNDAFLLRSDGGGF